jgi:prepilin-type N-terminal cleavage/methylation domain-containing protein
MKKQSGFTLIELLLVLAIIGIISAIAIPALLGQRARARDKAAQDNVSSCMADMIGSYDKVKEAGTTPATMAAIIGTAAAPLIPQMFTATNPWATASHLTGYETTTIATETNTTPGTATATQAGSATTGQVQLGYLAPAAGVNGVVAASVYLQNTITVAGAATHNFTKTAGVD